MRHHRPIALALLLATSAAPALAQRGPDTTAAASDDTEDAMPDGPADPITVTARRRHEDPQKIPGSLSVVGGELLDRSYTVNTQQLSQLVPALNYSSANPRNTAFTVRGLGSSVVAVSQANDGLEPGVGFYVDQVYHARPATAAFDFSDVAQVEILRGPQGTVFGKNSTAGTINITTREPSFTREATEEISVGSFDFVQAKAAATGPLVGDTLAYRVSGVVTRRDGVIDNVRTGQDHNQIGNQAVRGQLLFRPSDLFQVKLSADFTDFQSNCCTQVYYRVATRDVPRTATRQFAGPTGLAAQFGYTPPSTNPYDRVTDIDARLGVDTNEGGVAAIADWKLGTATLTSVSAWRFWNWDAANDRDYTGIPIQTEQHIPSRQDQYSQELRVASSGDGALSYVGGLYFFRQRVIGRPISIYGAAAARYLIGTSVTTGTAPNQVVTPVPANLLDGYGTDGRTDFRSNSYAAFGEVNWRPIDRVTLTGGLRYTYEHKTGTYDTFVFGGLPTTSTALTNAKLSILRGQSYAAEVDDGALTGRANIAWQATDAVLGYVSVARGEKSGGINMSGLPLDDQNQPAIGTAVVRPEKNTAYEAGLKTRLFDRVTLNVDAFYTRVTDFQTNVSDTRAAAALRTYLANIPLVTVRGAEADATAAVARDLSLRASVAYADGRYDRYPAGPCPIERIGNTAAACDLGGTRLPGLPKWSATVGGDYRRPVASIGGSLVAHADANYRARQLGDPTGSRFTTIGAYTVVNGSIGYRSEEGWEIAVFVRNLFDRDYIQNVTIQAGNSGLILATPSDPRTIGLTFRAHQ